MRLCDYLTLTIQMKATEQHFPVVLLIKLHNVVLAFEHYILMVSLRGKVKVCL